MTKRDWILLAVLVEHGYQTQRQLAQRTGYSLGLVHASLKKLIELDYITAEHTITEKTKMHLAENKPQRAVILAAGMGLRMMPINQSPKGLLQVNNEVLIERTICQLQEKGITDITIITGYMQQAFEYLIDKYGVTLTFFADYTTHNTLHTLLCATGKLKNAYIIPSNVWFSRNPFNEYEYFSWYAVSEYLDTDSFVYLNRNLELVYTESEAGGNAMIGLAYLSPAHNAFLLSRLATLSQKRAFNHAVWEHALLDDGKMIGYARVMLGQAAFSIETYEQLRELDGQSKNLQSKRIAYISQMFSVPADEITNISGLFQGMTNHHMRFSIADKNYLLRVPGEGSNQIINRQQEADIYAVLKGRGISDIVTHISPEKGYKITEFWDGARNCDPTQISDVTACIRHLRKLHDLNLTVKHTFDIAERLSWFENLRGSSSFLDYKQTKDKFIEMTRLLDLLPQQRCLCHNDVADVNFLFVDNEVYLIDWEYGGMCDPHFDIAIFCIFADYTKEEIDRVVDIYYGETAPDIARLKVYAYCSLGGLLWAVWSEYKANMGVDFGQYTLKQYRYCKQFYSIAIDFAQTLGIEMPD